MEVGHVNVSGGGPTDSDHVTLFPLRKRDSYKTSTYFVCGENTEDVRVCLVSKVFLHNDLSK